MWSLMQAFMQYVWIYKNLFKLKLLQEIKRMRINKTYFIRMKKKTNNIFMIEKVCYFNNVIESHLAPFI